MDPNELIKDLANTTDAEELDLAVRDFSTNVRALRDTGVPYVTIQMPMPFAMGLADMIDVGVSQVSQHEPERQRSARDSAPGAPAPQGWRQRIARLLTLAAMFVGGWVLVDWALNAVNTALTALIR